MNSDLISIVIPTFNRAHIIEETLHSIGGQTHQNWECIVVDDGSTDHTEALLQSLVLKDVRIKFYKRPETKPKGANVCRNIGLELSKGDYIQFFDSDDIMYPTKLEASIKALNTSNADYAISKTIDFKHPNLSDLFCSNAKNYNFKKFNISHYNYVCQNLNWLTPDALIKATLAKQLRFNESLQRGQEYNFYVKLTLNSINAVFLDEFTTKRRLHDTSIKQQFSQAQVDKQAIVLRLATLKEIYSKTSKEVKRWYIANLAKNSSRTNIYLGFNNEFFLIKHTFAYFRVLAGFYLIIARIFKRLINRNEFLREQLKKQLA